MIYSIARHEMRQQVRNKVLWILLPLILAIAVLTAATHWQQQKQFMESQQYWQAHNEQLWKNQPDRHPHRVAHYGSMAFKPVSHLNFIEAGANPFIGNAVFLEAHRQNSASVKQFQYSGSNLPLGYPSLATLMLAIWPLVLIAISYNAISAEREHGTLKMTLALGVPWRRILLAKGFAYSAFTTLLLVILFVVLAVFMATATTTADEWKRLLSLFALYFLYSHLWIAAVLLISSFSRSSQMSLWTCLSAWLLVVVLIPRITTAVVQTLYPTPTRAAFDVDLSQTLATMGDSHNPNDPHFAEFRDRVLRQYGVETVEQLPINWRGLVMTEGERLTSVAWQEHYNQLQQQFQQQNALRERLAWLSPYLMTAILSSRLAGTDAAHFYAFEQQAEAFRFELIQKLNHHHTHDIQFANDREQKLKRNMWQEFSAFEFTPPHLLDSLSSASLLFLWFTIWLGAILFLFFRARRTWSTV